MPRLQHTDSLPYDNDDYYVESNDGGISLRLKIYLLIMVALSVQIISSVRTTLSHFQTSQLYDLLPLPTTRQYPVNPFAWKSNAAQQSSQTTAPEDSDLPFQPSKYNYSQVPLRTAYTLEDPPPPLPLPDAATKLFVLILSGRTNFEQRQAIRDTWAKNHTSYLFIIGGREEGLESRATWKQLQQEQSTYHDLLDTIHPDTYRSLPYKVHYALTWIWEHSLVQNNNNDNLNHNNNNHAISQYEWFAKVDDDVVVRWNLLEKLILQKFNPNHPTVIGDIVDDAAKATTGKWAEDPHYTPLYYPPWPRGATGYILSRPVANYVAHTSNLYYYQGEDVTMGIWLYEAWRHFDTDKDGGGDLTWIDIKDFVYQEGCSDTYIITGHALSPDQIRECYHQMGGETMQSHKSRLYHEESTLKLFRSVGGPDSWIDYDNRPDDLMDSYEDGTI